jgi:hypothetical protein
MSTRFSSALQIAAVGLLLTACAAPQPQIRSDYDLTADFSRYTSFSFMERSQRGGELMYDTIDDQRVMAAVTRELEARGYRHVDQDGDLLVNFTITSEDVQDIRTVPTPLFPSPYYGWRGSYYYPWPAYTYDTWVDTYEQGVLFIDLVDVERRQLVWEASSTGRVTQAAREDPVGAVDSAVAEMFARYPFRAGPGQ